MMAPPRGALKVESPKSKNAEKCQNVFYAVIEQSKTHRKQFVDPSIGRIFHVDFESGIRLDDPWLI